jgi:hypothetical protein
MLDVKRGLARKVFRSSKNIADRLKRIIDAERPVVQKLYGN